MKREEIKKPDYTAGIRHTTVGSDRHDVRRENFRNKTVRTAKRRSGLIGRLFACSATLGHWHSVPARTTPPSNNRKAEALT